MISTKGKRQPAKQVSAADREIIRDIICSAADLLRKKGYKLTVPEIRREIHEMVDVSV